MEVNLFLLCIMSFNTISRKKGAQAAYLQFRCKGMKEEVPAISHLRLSCEICLKQTSSSTNPLESF